jgi:hypothetical protein
LQIAGNDKVHKTTFYKAEGGAMLGSELLEQNFSCPIGFTSNAIANPPTAAIVPIWVNTLALSNKATMSAITIKGKLDDPTNLLDPANPKYDAAYSLTGANLAGGALPAMEVGYLYFGGSATVLPGGALEMAAGYEGKGKSSAQGGVAILTDIYSQFKGLTNSESIILYGWRHIVGSEGSSGTYCP